MFLVIHTSQKKHTSFNCSSKTQFCEISSKKYGFDKIGAGRLVFDLNKIKGTDDLKKVTNIFKNLEINYLNHNEETTDISNQQLKHIKDLYNYHFVGGLKATPSYINHMILEINYNAPYDSLFNKQEINEQGYYFIKDSCY